MGSRRHVILVYNFVLLSLSQPCRAIQGVVGEEQGFVVGNGVWRDRWFPNARSPEGGRGWRGHGGLVEMER